jgi:hypothetical protein
MIRINDDMVDEGLNGFHLFMKMKINQSIKRRWKWKIRKTHLVLWLFKALVDIYETIVGWL